MSDGGGKDGPGGERAADDAAFPRVTDALTRWVWRMPASEAVRAASAVGITAPTISLVETVLSALAFALFWNAQFWAGLLIAFGVSFVAVVGLLLERTVSVGSVWASRARLAVELASPAFWWWAWAHGLPAAGHQLAPVYATMVLWVVVGGYVSDLAIDGLSRQRFAGLSIHAWRPIDTRFRLVAAGRNANLVILTGSLLFGRPDVGLELVAWWTLITLIFHSVRFAQLTERQARGETIVSWLDR